MSHIQNNDKLETHLWMGVNGQGQIMVAMQSWYQRYLETKNSDATYHGYHYRGYHYIGNTYDDDDGEDGEPWWRQA